jgi:23S rRNA U2552 (ribose-2'-O)-methylase RlmE/FtsJ
MTISKKRKLIVVQLDEYLTILDKSLVALEYSYDKCNAIGEKGEYDLEQQESFEALTSRFARTSDILTQKVFKSIFILLQEDMKTIIDMANFLEKLEIVDNADDLLNIREIRNQIANEYVEPDVKSLFRDVLHYVPQLKNIINNVKAYYKNLTSIKPKRK